VHWDSDPWQDASASLPVPTDLKFLLLKPEIDLGSIEDYFTVHDSEMRSIKPILTVIDGDVVHDTGADYDGYRILDTNLANRGSPCRFLHRGSRRSQTSQCERSSNALSSQRKAWSIWPSPACTNATP
jgi:hypothetical protein